MTGDCHQKVETQKTHIFKNNKFINFYFFKYKPEISYGKLNFNDRIEMDFDNIEIAGKVAI